MSNLDLSKVKALAWDVGGTMSSLGANAVDEIPSDSQYDVVAKDFNELSARLLSQVSFPFGSGMRR